MINIMDQNSTKTINVGIKPWLQALSCPKKTDHDSNRKQSLLVCSNGPLKKVLQGCQMVLLKMDIVQMWKWKAKLKREICGTPTNRHCYTKRMLLHMITDISGQWNLCTQVQVVIAHFHWKRWHGYMKKMPILSQLWPFVCYFFHTLKGKNM